MTKFWPQLPGSIRNISSYAIFGVAVWSITLVTAQAIEYHVAKTGDDSNPGSLASPWLTLSKAASTAATGDAVIVHAGSYNEKLAPANSGGSGTPIVFKAAAGELAVISGSGLPVTGLSGLVDLSNRSFIRIEGFEIRNYSSATPGLVPVGILIQGGSNGIEIVDNFITGIASTAAVDGNLLGRDAHGIAAYGNASIPITNLLIQGNELTNLTLGSSEAMVLNGNVTSFSVINNHVHHCDNIGIDAIGFEGIAPSVGLDRARNGLISANLVHHITSGANPAYGGETSAGGIYVDGGRDIIVERNQVHHCDIGIEIASEHLAKSTSGIAVRSNLIRENSMGGLFMGGYDQATTGSANNCTVTHNTFYNNDTDPNADEYGQIHLQYRVNNSVIANNILYHDITKSGQYNIFIVQWNTTGTGLSIHHNLHHGPDTPVWVLKDQWREGWNAYLNDPLSGSNELWGNPAFTSPATPDFTPNAGSPALDNGDAAVVSPGELDLDGNERSHGGGPDRGAIERDAAPGVSGDLLVPVVLLFGKPKLKRGSRPVKVRGRASDNLLLKTIFFRASSGHRKNLTTSKQVQAFQFRFRNRKFKKRVRTTVTAYDSSGNRTVARRVYR